MMVDLDINKVRILLFLDLYLSVSLPMLESFGKEVALIVVVVFQYSLEKPL